MINVSIYAISQRYKTTISDKEAVILKKGGIHGSLLRDEMEGEVIKLYYNGK